MMVTRARRDWRDRLGAAGENHAARLLQDAGLEILQRRFRCNRGEIDLIARDANTVVFVEVKLRRDNRFGEAIETVRWRQQRRLVATAGCYLRQYGWPGCESRFDVIGLSPKNDRLVAHWVRNAFYA